MNRMRPLLLLAALLLVLGATSAWADDSTATGNAPPTTQGLLQVLLIVILILIGCVGTGATALLLRIILPGVARSADASLARLGTGRLVFGGVLPLIGVALGARGVQVTGSPVLGGLFALVVVLPLAVALLLGAMAALPHLGAQVLRADANPSPIVCASVGGLLIGLAGASWLLPPLGVAVSVLFAGWLLGIGLGAMFRRPAAATPDVEGAPDGGAA
jgi:hypothetical protein